MKIEIDCPYCDGQAHLKRVNGDYNYRKETFKVVDHFYKCNKCLEEFTTTETDTITLLQAHNQYREKYNIPFVEDIFNIRQKYQLSAAKMSEVLGLGVNGYANYEKGEMPTPAIGNLIYTASNPSVFFLLLEKAKHYFTQGTFEKAKENLEHVIKMETVSNLGVCRIDLYNQPNSFTGYKKLSINKLSHLITAFIPRCEPNFNDRIKLNKLLFYADFSHYKVFGYSITGLSYRAIPYGPAPTLYDSIYTYLENESVIISNWIEMDNGAARELFITEEQFEKSYFSKEELGTIEIVLERFKEISSWDLVKISHEEKGWLDLNSTREVISYQYAFDLKEA